jgi:predicted MFS family arabinose efflux permease
MTQQREYTSFLGQLLKALGLATLLRSSGDIKILCLSRLVRLIGYGASTLVLVSHLQVAAEAGPAEAGLFMTLTLVGDVLISLALAMVADSVGRRAVLALGAGLMAASGIVFAISRNYWVLLAAAVFGVISPR